MKQHRFSLERYKGRASRHLCPECQTRSFTRYIDNESGLHISSLVGRCNREEKCGYHFPPREYFKNIQYKCPDIKRIKTIKKEAQSKPPSLIPKSYLHQTLGNYQKNNFALGLYQYFPKEIVNKTLREYFVGTTDNNKTIFWQVSRNGQVRTGKVMFYNVHSLKRSKTHFNWMHKTLKLQAFNLKQVFFGSHLLIDKKKPVAIVEGEKNAIVGSLYYPKYTWLAVGSIQMLSIDKLNAFKEYDVTLFPDRGKGYKQWLKIADHCINNIKVNNIIEKSSLPDGSDIADLVLTLKNIRYKESPSYLVDKMTLRNHNIPLFIKAFNLKPISILRP